MEPHELQRAERIRKSKNSLGIPSLTDADIEWLIEEFFELLDENSELRQRTEST